MYFDEYAYWHAAHERMNEYGSAAEQHRQRRAAAPRSPSTLEAAYAPELLAAALDAHAGSRATSLGGYADLASGSDDPMIAEVVRLIVEDEQRQQSLLRRMTATMRDSLEWTRSPDALPVPAPPQSAIAANLVAYARAAVEQDRADARSLRNLARRSTGLGAGLMRLLLERMAADMDQHARLLQFVVLRLQSRQPAEQPPRKWSPEPVRRRIARAIALARPSAAAGA